jgi:hypothetical protein
VQDYLDAAELVRSAGASAAFESASWSDLDTVDGRRKAVDALASAAGRATLFTIKVLDTTVNTVPADLRPSTFDSTAVIGRFHALLDTLRPSLAGVRYLSIGNEVDVYLRQHPEQRDAYHRFLVDAVEYAHATLPGVAIGVTSTFDGAGPIADLLGVGDTVILTYYPLGPGFVPRPPSTATGDLVRMLDLAGGKPLVLQEVGYPSDPRLSSSDDAQAAFVRAVFDAWHGAGSRAPFLNWFALHDFTPELCGQLAGYYGGPPDPAFTAFLCSLGLRRVDGTPKPAWSALVEAAQPR